MSEPRFQLTRQAAMDLRDIYRRSRQRWGDTTAQRYVADLYQVMARIAEKPELGELRQYRSAPFLMFPARQHFVIYDRIPNGVVVLTVLHHLRDIEEVLARQESAFLQEIDALRRRIHDDSTQ